MFSKDSSLAKDFSLAENVNLAKTSGLKVTQGISTLPHSAAAASRTVVDLELNLIIDFDV